jgi:hypothetical protein
MARRKVESRSVPSATACVSSGCSITSGFFRRSSWLSVNTPARWIAQLPRNPTSAGHGEKTPSWTARPHPTSTGAIAVGSVCVG